MRERSGFSLVEVTLAIGIIAFALVAIMALIPVGLNSRRDAIDATHSSLIGQDAQTRVKSSVTSATFLGGDAPLPPWFYNRDGVFVDVAANGYSTVVYRTDAIIHGTWNSALPNVDATVLRPVTVNLGWPVNPTTHSVVGNSATSFTFYVRKP
jgi:uncharacterized protein (TIGR02598 family)